MLDCPSYLISIPKHETGAIDSIIIEMKKFANRRKLNNTVRKNLAAAQTYFTNNRKRMDYADHVVKEWPIGSGMRWKQQGAKVILSLRALIQSKAVGTVLG